MRFEMDEWPMKKKALWNGGNALRSAGSGIKLLDLLVLARIASLDSGPFGHVSRSTATVHLVVFFSVNRTVLEHSNCSSKTPLCHFSEGLIDHVLISCPLGLCPFRISISEKIAIVSKTPIWNPEEVITHPSSF
jgi:hypothetical protein